MCTVNWRKKYFKTKYRPVSILLNVNAMICLKFKLQLQIRNNKNYLFIILKFHTGLH